MTPVPAELLAAELLPDFWNQIASECMITVTCLLPNGIIVMMEVSQNATLAEIKEVRFNCFNFCFYLLLYNIPGLMGGSCKASSIWQVARYVCIHLHLC